MNDTTVPVAVQLLDPDAERRPGTAPLHLLD